MIAADASFPVGPATLVTAPNACAPAPDPTNNMANNANMPTPINPASKVLDLHEYLPAQAEYPSVLARKLTKLSGLDRAFFCNSGTEAWEGALKFARVVLNFFRVRLYLANYS